MAGDLSRRKYVISSEGFVVFSSICCDARKHTWGYTYEGGQIIFYSVTKKDMHHTSVGPYALVHFIVVKMQMGNA